MKVYLINEYWNNGYDCPSDYKHCNIVYAVCDSMEKAIDVIENISPTNVINDRSSLKILINRDWKESEPEYGFYKEFYCCSETVKYDITEYEVLN